jgi:hypothetical protein
MLLDPARGRGDDHLAVGLVVGGLGHRRAGDVVDLHLLHDVHLRGVDGDGDLVRLGIELGQHVARVVGQPLGVRAFSLGREGDRAADLDDQVRHGLAHAGDQLIELGQALGALAIEFAHVQVQDRGARVVAVHGLLDLRFHRDGMSCGKSEGIHSGPYGAAVMTSLSWFSGNSDPSRKFMVCPLEWRKVKWRRRTESGVRSWRRR